MWGSTLHPCRISQYQASVDVEFQTQRSTSVQRHEIRGTVADSFKTSCFKNHTAVRVTYNADTQIQMILYRVSVFTKINMDRISCTGKYCWCQMDLENSEL